jgi:hypothetical protein
MTGVSEDGEFQWIRKQPNGITFRYRRVYRADCSLLAPGKEECWTRVRQELGLTQKSLPQCGGDLTRTDVAYSAETVIQGAQISYHAIDGGGPIHCYAD